MQAICVQPNGRKMIQRIVCLAILTLAAADGSHAREPLQLAQTTETSGKDAEQLAERELNIGRFNMDKHNFTGAINRFKTVVTQYPTSTSAEEALTRLAESYLALGITSEAQCAVAVLQRKFPDGTWSHLALDGLKSAGLEPVENEEICISGAFK